jgi:methionine-rich copper-binding protein CopC
LKNLIRNTGVAAAALVAALALITTAYGHAHPDTTTPAKGAVLQASPPRVEIIFVEDIQKTAGTFGIDVAKDGGASVTSGAATIDPQNPAKLSVALQSNLAASRYVVNWHNVSAEDGDPAEGAFSFYVKTQPTADDLAKDTDLEMVGQEEMETPTAAAAAPTVAAPASTPIAAASPAASAPAPATGAQLPRTGTGSGTRSVGWMVAAVITGLAGMAALPLAALAARKRR